MNEKEYFIQRVDQQIDLFDQKSKKNKKLYIWFHVLGIYARVKILLLLILYKCNDFLFVVLIGFFCMLIIITIGVLLVFNFQEKWNKYRNICMLLQYHKLNFLTKNDIYNCESAFPTFVKYIENIISKGAVE